MPAAEFEPAIPASERLTTNAFDRANTGTSMILIYLILELYCQSASPSPAHVDK